VASLFVGMGGGTFLPFQSLYFRTQLRDCRSRCGHCDCGG
jgi:hypothetical protein